MNRKWMNEKTIEELDKVRHEQHNTALWLAVALVISFAGAFVSLFVFKSLLGTGVFLILYFSYMILMLAMIIVRNQHSLAIMIKEKKL